ncbi:MAG: DUF2059 domain-containing protein [Planctomycetes bacterium]|nr:DUF2059 domain-containing protein [Planctomycetota bacterium]
MKPLIISCFLILCSFTCLTAEENTAELNAAVLKLFTTMDMETIYNTTFAQSIKASIAQNPMMAAKSDEIIAFYKKNLGWAVMRDEIAVSYVKKFSLAELQEIEVFYASAVGKKLAQAQPALTAEQQKINSKLSAKVMPELMKILQEK